LHVAVDMNHRHLVERLLAMGASPARADEAGDTPLQLAEVHDLPDLHRLMAEWGR
jgi:ankyrin repeat protein